MERMEYGQGKLGACGETRDCGQQVNQRIRAQEYRGQSARDEERRLQAKPRCCKQSTMNMTS